MHQNKLFKIISLFSKKEMTRFMEFTKSPYFNKRKDVVALTSYLHKIFPDFNEKRCRRESLFKKIFPKTKYDKQQLFLVFTYTNKLLEEFITQEQLSENQALQKILLIEWLRDKNELGQFEKKLDVLAKILNQSKTESKNYYYWSYKLATERFNFQTLAAKKQEREFLLKKQINLDNYYFLEKLQDACELKVLSNIAKTSFSLPMLEPVLESIRQQPELRAGSPVLSVYFQMYQLLEQQDPEQYFVIKKLLHQYEDAFLKGELQSLYNYLQNYCIAQINLGNAAFLGELFNIYEQQLNKSLLLQDLYLFEWHYKNIVTIGLRLNKTEWIYQFIHQYKSFLPEEVREHAFSFNLASYYYAIKDFDKVLELLIQIEYRQIQYNLGAKALLLRTYFEIGEAEATLSLADSFRQFLIRNKSIPANRVQGFMNLIKYTKKIVVIGFKKGVVSKDKWKSILQKTENEIKTTQPLYNKAWVLEKLKELEL